MEMLVLNPDLQGQIIRDRDACETGKQDEVWEGVYVVLPEPDDEHQLIVTAISATLFFVIQFARLGEVRAGINVSDRAEGWTHNYRDPDVAVFLRGTSARNLGTHWVGGPDFAVEVLSPNDFGRRKIAFYAGVGVRELLIVDRYPWKLELYRLRDADLKLAGVSTVDSPEMLSSEILPLGFRLIAGEGRPRIEVAHADGVQGWTL